MKGIYITNSRGHDSRDGIIVHTKDGRPEWQAFRDCSVETILDRAFALGLYGPQLRPIPCSPDVWVGPSSCGHCEDLGHYSGSPCNHCGLVANDIG